MSVASASVSAIAHPRRFIKPSTRAPRDGFISPRWSRLIVTRLHRLSDYFQNPARFMRALRWSSWDSSRPVCSRRCFDVVTCFYFLSSFRCQLSILRGMSRFFRNSFFRWKKKELHIKRFLSLNRWEFFELFLSNLFCFYGCIWKARVSFWDSLMPVFLCIIFWFTILE